MDKIGHLVEVSYEKNVLIVVMLSIGWTLKAHTGYFAQIKEYIRDAEIVVQIFGINRKCMSAEFEEVILVEVKKMNEKYTWTEIGAGTGIDDIWRHDVFSSVEECIKDAVSCGIKPGEKIAVGICENYVPHPSAGNLLDQVSEDAYEEFQEAAEGWPEFERYKGYIGVDKLQEKLDKVFNEWLKETNQVPEFYHVQPLADLVMIPEA